MTEQIGKRTFRLARGAGVPAWCRLQRGVNDAG